MKSALPTPKKSRVAVVESPRDRDRGFGFRIKNCGDLHLHDQCVSESPPIAPGDPLRCLRQPAAGNACLRPSAGRKHQFGPVQELAPHSATTCVPSSSAAGAMPLVRRFQAGASAGNGLEHRRLVV